jgi:choline dehydrogenase-like flavoprotein
VRLADERDALGLRRVRLDWQVADDDFYTFERGVAHLAREVGRLGLGRVQLPDPEGRWHADVKGAWHHLGTTRMAGDPSRGVVDAELRVHGLGNLYVAGSSVFPTGGASNPTFTLVALAIRLADHLARSRA